MKRFFSILLISALVFSLAACSVEEKNEETTQPQTVAVETTTLTVPVIESSTHSKQFKDENGRVVYTVDVIVPQLDEFENESLKAQVNTLSTEIFNDACEKAEPNIANAAKFMDDRNSDIPWAKKIDFEVSFSDGRYLSFVIKEYFSTLGEETQPSLRGATFDVLDSSMLYLSDFVYDADSSLEENANKIADKLLSPRVSEYFYNNRELTDEEKQLVRDAFFYENFYLTSDGIGFFMSKYIFDPMLTGSFACHFTWEQVSGILKLPE